MARKKKATPLPAPRGTTCHASVTINGFYIEATSIEEFKAKLDAALKREAQTVVKIKRVVNRARAFTLIELLVVVRILCALLALLAPALAGSRGIAVETKCRENLRQLATAVRVYVEDFKQMPTDGWSTRGLDMDIPARLWFCPTDRGAIDSYQYVASNNFVDLRSPLRPFPPISAAAALVNFTGNENLPVYLERVRAHKRTAQLQAEFSGRVRFGREE